MAIKPMSEDMDLIQKLTIPGLDTDMDVIQKLDDEPNDVGGLSPAELKAEFDKAGNIIKGYINEELLPAISDTVAEAEARAEAEAGRVQAETERVEAEQSRVEAEQSRVTAELEREEAEEDRAQAEEQRKAAEEIREDAERGYLAEAEESAEKAAEAERKASESKTAAEQAEADAAESAARAETAAEAAAESAAAAQASAMTAAGHEQGAEAAQQAAAGRAEAAEEFAGRAEQAAASAAENAEQAAEDAAASGENAQKAETAAQTAGYWAEQTRAEVEGDFATRPELEQVQETAERAVRLALNAQRIISATPCQSGQLTYNGYAQSPSWNDFNPEQLELSGVTEGVDAGTYEAVFTPKGEFMWADETQDPRTVSWSIGRAIINDVPAQSGSLTYTGAAQSPAWSNYDSNKLTLGGTTLGTNAGSYTATFTPKENYQWADGTTTAKEAAWVIGKAAGSLTIDKTSLALSFAAKTGTITVTREGDGAITATSSNTGVATVSVSGNVVTVTGKASGNATITISVGAGTNHNAPANKTCSVSASLPSTTLNANSWAMIRAVSDAGQGANYWSVGATKSITINGTVGVATFSNLTVDVFIIGPNHNSSREGSNRIHFQIGKIGGKMVGLIENRYADNVKGEGYFHMNNSNTSSGGWSGSSMRNTLLGNSNTPTSPLANSLMAALPSDLRAVMKSVTKYSDNTGNATDAAIYVTATTDYLFLLSEFEYQGARTYANSTEKNYQAQYDYYKAGNSKVHYKHSNTAAAAYALCRSAGSSTLGTFCIVDGYGNSGSVYAYASYAIAPGFCV